MIVGHRKLLEELPIGDLPRMAIDESYRASGNAHRSGPALLRCMRPKQWIKNLFLFAGVLFTLDQGHGAGSWLRAAMGFCVFCFLSAAVYLINDVVDAERDRQHPKKRFRPIAAGELDAQCAAVFAAVLALASLATAFSLGPAFGAGAGAYFLLTLAYSFGLKHLVIVDLLTIAAGFVLRAAAGAFAVGVPISPWLLVCTSLLALFLGLTKRRAELVTLQSGAGQHRKILEEYSPEMLDQMLNVVMASTLMSYALYTFNSPTAHGHHYLMATTPFVIYGLFRYLYLVHRKNAGGSIASELIMDRPLLINILLWAASCGIIVGAIR